MITEKKKMGNITIYQIRLVDRNGIREIEKKTSDNKENVNANLIAE